MPFWFWVVVAVALLALAAALLVPLRLELSAEARAEPDGQWAAAAGVALGPLALSAVGGKGVPPSVHVFAFGKRRISQDLSSEVEEVDEEGREELDGEGEGGPPPPRRPSRIAGWLRRRFDLVDGVVWALGERRRLRWQLDVDVAYSFRDVALTGKVLGGAYLLVPLLPNGIHLRQTPSWDSVDRAALQASGTLRIFAGLVLSDLIWYMLKRSFGPGRKAQGR